MSETNNFRDKKNIFLIPLKGTVVYQTVDKITKKFSLKLILLESMLICKMNLKITKLIILSAEISSLSRL